MTAQTDFSHNDDVRKFVPQLSQDNIEGNFEIINLLSRYAEEKKATNAQIALAWMLAKYPNIVPIPGSKNKERILENLGASEVQLSAQELEVLDNALDKLPVKGHRGQVEFDGDTMADWGKEK